MIREDYFVKLIRDCLKFFAKIVFNQSIEEVEEQLSQKDAMELNEYLNLFNAHKMDEIKILLQKQLKKNKYANEKIVCIFYVKLNDYTDEELLDRNYSRSELEKDIGDFMNEFGYGDISKIYFGD